MIAVYVEECRSGVHEPSLTRGRPLGDGWATGVTVIDATKVRELNDNRGTD